MKKQVMYVVGTMLVAFSIPLVLRLFSPTTQNRIQIFKDDVLFNDEVEKYVGVGSDINDAKQLLKNDGFSCSMRVEWGRKYGGAAHMLTSKADFLECGKNKKLLFGHFWSINVRSENGMVTHVNTDYSTNGVYGL
jgi:tartrate dehydratase beta subunit/fumarate hydratase class I family protein